MRPGHWLYTIPLRLQSLFRWAQADRELDDELRDHVERKTEEYVAKGMAPEEAQYRARIDLGRIEQTKEKCREARRVNWIQDLVQDLHFGLRMLRKSPGFTAVAVITLALGIGANTAIYSLMDALLMRRLPVADPASLVLMKWHITGKDTTNATVVHNGSGSFDDDPKMGKTSAVFPFPAFEVLRRSHDALFVLFAYHPAGKRTVVVGQQAEITGGEYVSGDYFQGLNTAPAAGRLITSDDDRPGAPAVVVLSHGFAETHFGDAAGAVGQKVLIDNIPFTT